MKPLVIMVCLLLVSVVSAVFVAPGVLFAAIAPLAGTVYFAYYLGTRRSLVVDEDEIPHDIYQVVAIIRRDTEQIAILRNSKRKRFAVGSLGKEFQHFVTKSEGAEKFFVPKALSPLKTTTVTETSAVCTQ